MGKLKSFVLLFLILFVDFFILKYYFKMDHFNSIKTIELLDYMQIQNEVSTDIPYWISVRSKDDIIFLEKSYGIDLSKWDYDNMLVISYGAELKSLKYSLHDSTLKKRKAYIGFPTYGKTAMDKIFVYLCREQIPLINSEVAGYSPEYGIECIY